jgi:uncharacterized membrane protein
VAFPTSDTRISEAFRWTEETGIVGLGFLPGTTFSRAGYPSGTGQISGDGSTIVGQSLGDGGDYSEIFVHTQADGMLGLGHQITARAASLDGSVVVGYWANEAAGRNEAFRWTEEEGIVGLLSPEFEDDGTGTGALDVSDDGSVVVGNWTHCPDFPCTGRDFFRWTSTTGMQLLGVSTNGAQLATVSSDGLVIVGNGFINSPEHEEAFRWTEESGPVGLGWLPGTELSDGSRRSRARGVNGDGSVIVGNSGQDSPSQSGKAFILREARAGDRVERLEPVASELRFRQRSVHHGHWHQSGRRS